MTDEPRLLHQRSEFGYTRRSHEALKDEPEAVSEDEQLRMSQRARDAERARARDAWRQANTQITEAVNGFREHAGHVPPSVVSGTRAVLRAAAQVERKLA